MSEMKDLFRAYRVAHKYREEWYNIKWRTLVIISSMAFIVFVYRYLFDRYEWFIDDFQFILADKLFYWFMIGALFGIIAIGMIFEGEFLLGLRNISRELADAEKKILKPEKAKALRPAPKRRK
ncbi:MAG TPA: hypothetical protein VJI13_03730 [Candidatus Norongarragalinales archaeon]|nr:hypothetical protein [Candidatus Norongarragalinales archaeon]